MATSDAPLLLPQDEPPRDGVWRDWEDQPLTDDEIRLGLELGAAIDVDDPHDNGLYVPSQREVRALGPLASSGSALRDAERLAEAMRDHGVRVSIELQEGRPWSGDRWWSKKYVLMNHHTAGSPRGATPSLYICKHGRTGLPGPLCNGYGGRDLVYRIFTFGLGNHPGRGGPLTIDGVTIPRDSARISTWGTEWEHDGVSEWRDEMREFMGRSNAALLEFWGRPYTSSIEHSTWTSRKIDRNTYSARDGVEEIRLWAGKPDVWDGRSFPGRDAFRIGQGHPAIPLLLDRLHAHTGVRHTGTQFQPPIRDAIAAFQREQGWTGTDANGYVGPVTWDRLMAPTETEALIAGVEKGDPVATQALQDAVRAALIQVIEDDAVGIAVWGRPGNSLAEGEHVPMLRMLSVAGRDARNASRHAAANRAELGAVRALVAELPQVAEAVRSLREQGVDIDVDALTAEVADKAAAAVAETLAQDMADVLDITVRPRPDDGAEAGQ